MEKWVSIKGYEGLYEVSDMGRVKSLKFGKEKILKPENHTFGYYRVILCKDGINKKYRVHRLVCLNFLDNPENKPQVNHKNGDKKDNRLENLEWCNNSENQKHAYDNGLQISLKGSKHGRSKLTDQQVLEIRSSNLTQKELGKIYGVAHQQISKIKRRETWTHI